MSPPGLKSNVVVDDFEEEERKKPEEAELSMKTTRAKLRRTFEGKRFISIFEIIFKVGKTESEPQNEEIKEFERESERLENSE